MSKRFEIMVVDDDRYALEVCQASLEHQGYVVTTAVGGKAAAEALQQKAFDLVLSDYRLKHHRDFFIFHRVKEHHLKTKVIIVTADHDAYPVVEAFRLGVDDYLLKPYDISTLWERVAYHLRGCRTDGHSMKVLKQFPALNEEILKMLSVMTHDIKDSLTSMASTLTSIRKGSFGTIPEDVDDKLKELYAVGKRLIGMTEDFLGKAISVNGEVEVHREAIDLREDVVDPVLDELCTELHDCRIAIDNRLDVMPTNHVPVRGNRIWLRTVFRNLLKNAIHYGGKGCTVTIGIQDTDRVFRVNVFNSGPTVPIQYRDKLFSKFGRIAYNGGSRSGSGVGMGLYLTKEILKKHGGDIWYEASTHGSNFVFTIPHN